MPRSLPTAQARSRTLSWLDAIPLTGLRSFDQLQESAARAKSVVDSDPIRAEEFPLPPSEPGSDREALEGDINASIRGPPTDAEKTQRDGHPSGSLEELQSQSQDARGGPPVLAASVVPLPASLSASFARSRTSSSQQEVAAPLVPLPVSSNATSAKTQTSSQQQELNASLVPLPASLSASFARSQTSGSQQEVAASLVPLPVSSNATSAKTQTSSQQQRLAAPAVPLLRSPNASSARSQSPVRQRGLARLGGLGSNSRANNSANDGILQEPNYWTKVAPLAECLPHLQVLPLDHQSRWPMIGKVVCIDYPKGDSTPRKFRSWSVDRYMRAAPDWASKIESLKSGIDSSVAARLILVEDLSDQLIEALGFSFEIDPDYFAHHLAQSGYWRADYDDMPKHRWKDSAQSYASLGWLRPVLQHQKVSQWLESPELLLNKRQHTTEQGQSKVEHGISWLSKDTLHLVTPDCNIFRRTWGLSASAPGSNDEVYDDDLLQDSDWASFGVPTVWEEKATICVYSKQPVPIIILLLDPLPAIAHYTKMAVRRFRSQGDGPTVSHNKMQAFLPLAARSRVSFPKDKLHATPDDIARLHASLRTVGSAIAAITQRTISHRGPDTDLSSFDPLLALFQVVQDDTKAFARALEATLEQIGKDSLDDYLISKRLAHWRSLMSNFQTMLPAMKRSLHDFVGFLLGSQSTEPPGAIKAIVFELDMKLSVLESRIDETYAALRVDMQFAESRRSIAEAKTVTKLTELAFIFIPLSFVSSVFSMSVHELENGVPIWTFVLTALLFALLAFCIRLAVANDYFADTSRRAVERFWAKRGVDFRRGKSIPSHEYLLLIAQEVWNHGGRTFFLACLGLASMSAFVVVPVAFVWVSTALDTGFKTSVSLVLVLLAASTALGLTVLNGWMGELYGRRILGEQNENMFTDEEVSSITE